MKKQKVYYINELELKSMLIRVKNLRLQSAKPIKSNKRINQLIELYKRLNSKDYIKGDIKKKNKIKLLVYNRIMKLSENTCADAETYNNFAKAVLLITKNILRKPQFNGYSYEDEFYSDSSFKILKYIKNFDPQKISEKSGQPVNTFAYLTQIITNSIIFVINQHNKNIENINTEMHRQKLMIDIANFPLIEDTFYRNHEVEKVDIEKYFYSDYPNIKQEIRSYLNSLNYSKIRNLCLNFSSKYKEAVNEFFNAEYENKESLGLNISIKFQ